MPEADYRLYIDESGDHTYRLLDDENRRFLGITGVLIRRDAYDAIVFRLEQLKRKHLRYDPDDPPILVRSDIVKRKGTFGRFREHPLRQAWASDVLTFFQGLSCHAFTVVIDKQTHHERFGSASVNPYHYSFEVLLTRVRGLLHHMSMTADVMAESRGKAEDQALKEAYLSFWQCGSQYLTAAEVHEAFPNSELVTRRKDHNVAGLQVADLLAYGLKKKVLQERGKPCGPVSAFTEELNRIVAPRINRYGLYLLE